MLKELMAGIHQSKAYAALGDSLANELEHRPDIVEPVVNERVRAYSYLAALGRILNRYQINFIIDAGAHCGQFASSTYGFCGFQGEMHSFEPVTQFYQQLQASTKYYRGWRAYNKALGAVSGPSTVWVGKGHGGTSSLLPANHNLARFAPDCVLGEGQPIDVVRIDEQFGGVLSNPATRAMLKIDTQGFEEQVLAGCGSLLQKFRLLHVELCSVPLYEGQKSMGAMLNWIEEQGFRAIYFSNNFAVAPAVFVDFDVICVNRLEIESQ